MKPSFPRTFVCVASWCLALWAASAAAESFELTVKAGNHDRTNVPVSVLLEVAPGAKSATLTDEAGNVLPAQITRPGVGTTMMKPSPNMAELHFILPSLEKGRSVTLKGQPSNAAAPLPSFQWKNDTAAEHADLLWGDRPVMRYMYLSYDDSSSEKRHDSFKVYHHLFSPGGDRVVTKGPGGQYTHHRGLFFGYCNCGFDGRRVDTWGGGSGHQVHAGFEGDEAGPVLGRHCVAVDWRANDKTTFVKEQRELTVYQVPGGTMVDFASRLSTAGGKVTLDGNAPHAGFHFRADQEVAEKTGNLTYYLRPDGKGELGQARASAMDLPWDAMSFVLGEDRYTTLYLDRPDNPKPVEYNERTYGRFGSFFRFELDEGKDLVVHYRVWLQDGEMTVEQAAAMSADFIDPVEVTIK
ncbi:MAG TPA: DUF6807 family protein [Thermoguttaceae bacterium]|nr:DUF6807 family protein [Thermoguttaceae bacterium]